MSKTNMAAAGPPSSSGEDNGKTPRKFIWTGPTGFWYEGQLLLEQGKTYAANRVDGAVLAAWISTGHAANVENGNKEK